MKKTEMGDRGSKSESNPYLINSVKEQRVDGSSIYSLNNNPAFSRSRKFYSIPLYIVRCTLVAGKPVLGRNIFLSHLQNIRRQFLHFTPKFFNSDLHGLTSEVKPLHLIKNLDPWFVTGFIDAEGCFMLSLVPSNRYKNGYQVVLIFSISIHSKDRDLLTKISQFFANWSITKHGVSSIQYRVTSFKHMATLITHCNNYPLITKKQIDF